MLALKQRKRAQFQLNIVLAIAEHDGVLVLAGTESNLTRDAREEWIRDIGDDETHVERFLETQTSSELIGNKIDFLCNFSNRDFGLLADAIAISLTAQDTGNRGDRNAGSISNALKSWLRLNARNLISGLGASIGLLV
jgi:hypothetical protein